MSRPLSVVVRSPVSLSEFQALNSKSRLKSMQYQCFNSTAAAEINVIGIGFFRFRFAAISQINADPADPSTPPPPPPTGGATPRPFLSGFWSAISLATWTAWAAGKG